MALRTIKPRLRPANQAAVEYKGKSVDPFYVSPEWKETRAAILKRDNYQCAVPGCKAVACVVDHILRRKDGGTEDWNNLRSLCRTHDGNMKEDHLGRRKNIGQITR